MKETLQVQVLEAKKPGVKGEYNVLYDFRVPTPSSWPYDENAHFDTEREYAEGTDGLYMYVPFTQCVHLLKGMLCEWST
jgi:hypothetical protein